MKFMKKNINLDIAIVFIIGVLFSSFIYYIVSSIERANTKYLFENNVKYRFKSIEANIDRHLQIVNYVDSLFLASTHVSREAFKVFTSNILKINPTAQALSWNPFIKNHEKELYIQKARKDGLADFKITGFNSDGKIVVDQTKEYFIPVYYIEPYTKNKKAMGFDISSQKARLKAIIKARDTGKPIITERIKLVQSSDNVYSYLLLKPLYENGKFIDTKQKRRKYFKGVVVGVFKFSDLILQSIKTLEPIGVDLILSDVTVESNRELLYFHQSRTRKNTIKETEITNGELKFEILMNVNGRKWSFLFTPAPSFINKHKTWYAFIFLIIGLGITFILILYIFIKTKHTEKLNQNYLKIREQKEEISRQNSLINHQARHAQMGEMVAMIAHQWRQPLSSISAAIITLQMKQELNTYDKSFYDEQFDSIINYTQHLSNTINDFRSFFKENKEKISTSLESIIDSSLEIIEPIFNTTNIELIRDYQCNNLISTYPNEIRQVLLNLLKNAIDITKDKDIHNPMIKINTYLKDDKYYLEIADNANGVPNNILDKIFDPYFTTKNELNGTGLGLYMSKKIIEEHCGGKLSVVNKDNGACFIIELEKDSKY